MSGGSQMEVPPACSWSRAGTRLTSGWGWLHPEHESLVRELEYPCALCCSHPQSFVTWSWVKGPKPSLCIRCCWALPARGSALGPCSNLGRWMGLGRWGRRRQDRAFYAFICAKKAGRCWGRTGAPGQAPAARSTPAALC